jgi:putative radical SAM enzyme (TIGR03279 family)
LVKIINIQPGSIAEDLGIQPGSTLIAINGKEIRDRLDYRFYESEENLDVHIKQGDEEIIFEIEKEPDEDLGLELEEMKLMSCGNNCVFCFTYQNPKGMRKSLYFKDEDYRYSFLYGHYVTMTTLKQSDLDRIVEQRLSPLYISVHSTDPQTRKWLLGIRRDDHLLEKIEFLTKNNIELHTQIVLVPGVNDGAVFEKTVSDLSRFYPQVTSVAVVPVGISRHRRRKVPLRIHTPQELKEAIVFTNKLRARFRRKLGTHFVYLSDEFFIKSGEPIPPAEYYDEFYQIENGVGEFREMIDRFESARPAMPKRVKRPVKITWVTGTLAAENLKKHIIDHLNKIRNVSIEMIPVFNYFYGTTIEVSGLLVGEDIYNQLKNRPLGDLVLLPPRVLNEDGLFLDDWTVADLEQKLNRKCHVFTEPVESFVEVINRLINEPENKRLVV